MEKIYQTVFPGRVFEGLEIRDNIDEIFSEPWFYLYDGKNQYEISEMSGGERAIFPMLVDFMSWNIHFYSHSLNILMNLHKIFMIKSVRKLSQFFRID
jgi:hypothetical protein